MNVDKDRSPTFRFMQEKERWGCFTDFVQSVHRYIKKKENCLVDNCVKNNTNNFIVLQQLYSLFIKQKTL
jgi:hypothetical protein